MIYYAHAPYAIWALSQNKSVNIEKGNKDLSLQNAFKNTGTKVALNSKFDGKTFLVGQYRGHCQICGEQINLHSGEQVIKCMSINPTQSFLPDIELPFNVLSLCPNCFSRATDVNTRDFSKILEYAEELKNGEVFPEECERMNGDYIDVPVVVNGHNYDLALSSEHLSYFSHLLTESDNIIVK